MAELLFQSKQEKLQDGSPIIITKILGAIDGTTVRQFEDKLIGFFNQGVKNLILIFSEVKYINSTGMGLLVKLADKFQEGGGDIKLVGVPEKVIALFDMLGLLSLFKIYETEEDAIDSIPAGGGGKESAPPSKPAETKTAAAPPSKPAPASPGSTSRTNTASGRPPEKPPERKPEPPKTVSKPVAVAPVPPPAHKNEEMEGGMVIGFDEGDSAPKNPVAWPHTAPCSVCTGNIEFSTKGQYRCVRCGAYMTIDEYGTQAVSSSVTADVVEMKYPCHQAYIAATKSSLNALAKQEGYSDAFNNDINEALDNALSIGIEKSSSPKESFQVLAVADSNEMVIGLKVLNPFLVQGGPKDPRLQSIARKVDRLEVFPLPNKGQLLKMTKKRK